MLNCWYLQLPLDFRGLLYRTQCTVCEPRDVSRYFTDAVFQVPKSPRRSLPAPALSSFRRHNRSCRRRSSRRCRCWFLCTALPLQVGFFVPLITWTHVHTAPSLRSEREKRRMKESGIKRVQRKAEPAHKTHSIGPLYRTFLSMDFSP